MGLSIFANEHALYHIETPVYQGPLDLLLQLIERAELDITKLALAQVTEQYLAHLRIIEEKAPEEVSIFLVIAAKLLQIKSEALLPKPPAREPGEEDPGDDLIRQLREYKQFKQVAGMLGEREQNGLRSYLRLAKPLKIPGKLDIGDLTVIDIHHLALALLTKKDSRENFNKVVKAPRITIRQKIRDIIRTIRDMGSTTFYTLLKSRPSRPEVVVTFLAMLELIKQRFVSANQETLFGDIALVPIKPFDEKSDFELEFKD